MAIESRSHGRRRQIPSATIAIDPACLGSSEASSPGPNAGAASGPISPPSSSKGWATPADPGRMEARNRRRRRPERASDLVNRIPETCSAGGRLAPGPCPGIPGTPQPDHRFAGMGSEPGLDRSFPGSLLRNLRACPRLCGRFGRREGRPDAGSGAARPHRGVRSAIRGGSPPGSCRSTRPAGWTRSAASRASPSPRSPPRGSVPPPA